MSILLKKLMGHVFMDKAGAGDGSDGGSGGGATGGDGGQGDAAAAGGGDTSLLDDLGGGEAGEGDDKAAAGAGDAAGDTALTTEQRAAKAAEKDTRRPKSVPAKFWNAEKGEVNFDAWDKSTRELEGRIRDVGLPPKSADEYKFEPPAALKEAGVDMDPDRSKAFRDEAFKAGLTQKQYEFVMSKYYGNLDELVSHGGRVDRTATLKALTDHYKSPEAVQANVKAAYDVFAAYADEDEMKDIYRVVNDPVAVRVLAKINKELQEDPGVKPESILTGESIDELMAKGSPYWDAAHPQHARVKAKVAAHYEAQAKAGARKRAA